MAFPPTMPDDRANGTVIDASHLNEIKAALADIVAEVETRTAQLTALEDALPRIRGQVSSEEALPATGTAGDLYLVGGEGDLYAWDVDTTAWISVGNISGPPGNPGNTGTIVGILGPGETPPVGTEAGTLWFVADSTPPAPAAAPAFVGSTGKFTGSIAGTTISPPAGVQDGDVGVLIVASNTTSGVTPAPAGWTLVDTVVDSSLTNWIFTRSMLSTDGAVTVNDTRSTRKALTMLVFRNVALNGSNLPHAHVSFNVSSANDTQTVPTLTTSVDTILVSLWSERQGTGVGYTADGSGFTVPSGFTLAVDAGTGNPGGLSTGTGSGECVAIGAYDLTERAAGTIPGGSPTWVREAAGSPTTNNLLWTLALEVAS